MGHLFCLEYRDLDNFLGERELEFLSYIYFLFCSHGETLSNLCATFDLGELQEIWLDRITGRVCMSISAKAMSITGIEDRRYWNWLPTEESRYYPNLMCYHS